LLTVENQIPLFCSLPYIYIYSGFFAKNQIITRVCLKRPTQNK
jgi:hypothetical protein